MRFVETPAFTAAIRRHLDDETVSTAANRVDAAPGARACHSGVRRPSEGPRDQACYMVYAYTKSEQGDLTPAQMRQLSRVVREEFK